MTDATSSTDRVNWRQQMIDENLWDYSLKWVPVPPVRQMVEEIESLRGQLDAAEQHVKILQDQVAGFAPGARADVAALNRELCEKEGHALGVTCRACLRCGAQFVPEPPHCPSCNCGEPILGSSPEPEGKQPVPLWDFWNKHAMPPKLCPSCLVCGQTTKPAETAITHMELPGIVVCVTCRDNARRSPEPREPFDAVPDEIILSLAREAQLRLDGSVGIPSMVVSSKTLADLCAEVSVRRALTKVDKP